MVDGTELIRGQHSRLVPASPYYAAANGGSSLVFHHLESLMQATVTLPTSAAILAHAFATHVSRRFQRGQAMKYDHIAGWIAALALLATTAAWGQPWRPDKVTEFITSSAAGGSNDQVARAMQKILQDAKLIATPIAVANKSGGNQTLAVVYLTQHPGDAHFLLLGNPTIFTNHIAGITPLSHADLTPVSLLLVEHTLITVKSDSPIKSMRDLVEQLRKDPEHNK